MLNAITFAPRRPSNDPTPGDTALTLEEFTRYFQEIQQQPAWRGAADKEMDYVDGNQLDSEILRQQREIGMPPAIEPLIGPAIDAVLGLEAKNRADWRVQPNDDQTGDDIAKALGFKLNQAERKSKADRACSEAYRSQICVGVGWVEVSRNPNPFMYPYRCVPIHRNQIWWDWLSTEPDLSDARYLIRRRWTGADQIRLMFPEQREVIDQAMRGWVNWDAGATLDGGTVPALTNSWNTERSWSVEEMQWRDSTGQRACLFECWYRRWCRVLIIKSPDGRVVEVDKKNPVHLAAIAAGTVKPEWVVVPKMRMALWMGPHCLKDEPTPYRHQKFPYVAFWGKREDRTAVPYGLVRGMIFMQDNVNATTSRLRWGMAAVRTTRTKGATVMTDAQLRNEIARPDADIVLNPEAMKPEKGGMFKVERDFNLSQQQFQLLVDGREGIRRVSGITPSLQGTTGTARSGYQEDVQVEQGTQAMADINDGFNDARAEVGELLLSLIVEDMMGKPEQILVKGKSVQDDHLVMLNQPRTDELTGMQYLDNDVARAMLKVGINDVPSTSSYRAQQLRSLSEAFKGMPAEFQRVVMPYLVALMDLPSESREDVIKAVREAAQAPTPEQMEEQIKKAVDEARMKDARDLKLQELQLRFPADMAEAQKRLAIAKAFGTTVDALYASAQTAGAIAMNPAIAPVADAVAQLAGYQAPTPAGVDPDLPVPAGVPMPQAASPDAMAAVAGNQPLPAALPGTQANTNPTRPPVAPRPPSPSAGDMGTGEGSLTPSMADNQPLEFAGG